MKSLIKSVLISVPLIIGYYFTVTYYWYKAYPAQDGWHEFPIHSFELAVLTALVIVTFYLIFDRR